MILVAGGTGHLGTQLIPLLTDRGIQVRVLTRDPIRARRRLGPLPELAEGDARQPASLAPALEDADTVVSAMTGFGPGGAGPRAIDYEANLNLIRAAERSGARRFVLVSMYGAGTDHPMELMRMKHRAEEALRASRLDWTIVRPNVFMELWAGIVGDPIVKAGKTMVFGKGDNPINFNSANDVARFIDLALRDATLSRTVMEVGGPENVTLNDLVREVEQATGRKAAVRHIPIPVMRLSRVLLRGPKPDIAGMIEAGINFDTADMSFDAAELQRRFPQVRLTRLTEVIHRQFSKTGRDAISRRGLGSARAAPKESSGRG